MSEAGISMILPIAQPSIQKSRKRRSSNDTDASKSPPARSMKQYPPEDKLEIIEHAKKHGNRAAGREFNVAESSIREWRKNEHKLIRSRDANNGMKNMHFNNVMNNNHIINNTNCQRLQEEILNAQSIEKLASLKYWNYRGVPTMIPFQSLNQPMNVRLGSNESVGTPNSNSSFSNSSSPPLSNSPTPSQPTGSGRRKIRAPQKISQEP